MVSESPISALNFLTLPPRLLGSTTRHTALVAATSFIEYVVAFHLSNLLQPWNLSFSLHHLRFKGILIQISTLTLSHGDANFYPSITLLLSLIWIIIQQNWSSSSHAYTLILPFAFTFLPTIISWFSRLKISTNVVLQSSIVFLLTNASIKISIFEILQFFSHIQIINTKTKIIASLRWYNLTPYLFMSQLIIKGLCDSPH